MNYAEIPSPCYVLNEAKLRRNLELLKRVQDEAGVEIICALKGFAMFSAFPLVSQYLTGATASSLNEARLIANEWGTKAHTYAPAYRDDEFDEILELSSHLTFNSWSQWERFRERVGAWNQQQRTNNEQPISCGIRINPQYSEVATDLYNPCIPGSRLGVVRSALPDRLPPEVEGLHFHTLCENDSHTLERTLHAVELRFGDLLQQVKWLNMGGGHLITRADYDPDHLIGVLKAFKAKFPHLHVILEPGSAVGWQTGVLVSTVLDVLDAQGIDVAILDTSFSNHMPDTLEMPYKPRVLGADSDPVPGKPSYRLGGMTCLAGDYMGDYSFEKPLQVGDKVVFDDMIHYTMVKTTTFNGVNLPGIGIWQEEETFRLVRSYGYESYRDRLS
jgi:carboxynorspermidine decarboxylase